MTENLRERTDEQIVEDVRTALDNLNEFLKEADYREISIFWKNVPGTGSQIRMPVIRKVVRL